MIPPGRQGDARSTSYVYLLRSVKGGRYYLGWTTDVPRRLEEHNRGERGYTASRGPWELVGYEEYASAEAAKRRERMLKRNPRMLTLFKKRLKAVVLHTASGGCGQVVG